jgi:peptide-methionine (S)-S-oxide reductase
LISENIQIATFGAGCFWGTEKYFAKDFAKMFPDGILGTCVGFMNPDPNT